MTSKEASNYLQVVDAPSNPSPFDQILTKLNELNDTLVEIEGRLEAIETRLKDIELDYGDGFGIED